MGNKHSSVYIRTISNWCAAACRRPATAFSIGTTRKKCVAELGVTNRPTPPPAAGPLHPPTDGWRMICRRTFGELTGWLCCHRLDELSPVWATVWSLWRPQIGSVDSGDAIWAKYFLNDVINFGYFSLIVGAFSPKELATMHRSQSAAETDSGPAKRVRFT